MMKNSSDQQTEILPWYRRSDYRGKMPESHKRFLDQIRMQGAHPAATYADLPEEAQRYVTSLELEIYNTKQQSLALGCMFSCACGLYFLYQWYRTADVSNLFLGLTFAAVPWVYYRIRSKKNWNEFWPDGDPNRKTNEAMQMEWDIHALPSQR
jgi:hypothetical protein